jgi:hypothetical protein
MKTANDVCPVGITEDTFVAWYDATLGNKEARQISDHMPTCEVCRSRLTEYTKLDQSLRWQRIPEVSQAPWEDMQAGISHTGHTSRTNARRHILETVGTLAAAILVIVGFLRAFQSHFGGPGPQATAVTARLLGTPTPLPTLGPSALPVPGTPPSWQAHTLRSQFVQSLGSSFVVSASDGATAYMCHAVPISGGSGAQQAQIWVTHNLGAQWTHVGNLPELGSGVVDCTLDVDSIDSKRLVAMLFAMNTTTLVQLWNWFASDDGGITWTKIMSNSSGLPPSPRSRQPHISIDHIATAQSKTYAIYTSIPASPTNVPTPTPALYDPALYPPVAVMDSHLAVSSDGLRTWQPVDEPILALVGPTQYVTQYWSQVGAGGQMILLAEVGGSQPNPQTLWESVDGGIHWSELPAPQLNSFTARASGSNHSWYICGWSGGSIPQGNQDLVTACSMDGGKTWSARPVIRTCESCPPHSLIDADGYITSDGSLIGLFGYKDTPAAALYRLPAHSSQWQYLGHVPNSGWGLIYVSAPSPAVGGYLWSFYGSGANTSDLTTVVIGTGSAAGMFFTSAYPI